PHRAQNTINRQQASTANRPRATRRQRTAKQVQTTRESADNALRADEILVQMLVPLPHALALRLQFREGSAVDAADAGDVPLAQRVQHLAQRFGFGGGEGGAADLAA